jgi:sec-independent protein translocase protein TatB
LLLSLPRIIIVPMSFSDTIFLFFLALILFGPKKLPEIARQAGKLLAELRRASNEFRSQIESEIAHLEVEKTRNATLTANPASLPSAPQQSVAREKEPGTLTEPSVPPIAGPAATNSAGAGPADLQAATSDSPPEAAPQPSPEAMPATQQESHV